MDKKDKNESTDNSVNSVEIKIDGKTFTMSGTKSVTYYKEVNRYINHKILELRKQRPSYNISFNFSALLLSINVVADYFAAEDTIFNMKKEIQVLEKELNNLPNVKDINDKEQVIEKLENRIEELGLVEELYLALKEEHEQTLGEIQEHKNREYQLSLELANLKKRIQEINTEYAVNIQNKVDECEKQLLTEFDEREKKLSSEFDEKEKRLNDIINEKQLQLEENINGKENEISDKIKEHENQMQIKFNQKEIEIHNKIGELEKTLQFELTDKENQKNYYLQETENLKNKNASMLLEKEQLLGEKDSILETLSLENEQLLDLVNEHKVDTDEFKKQIYKLKDDNFKLNEGFANINDVYKSNQIKIRQLEEDNEILKRNLAETKKEFNEYIDNFDKS